MSAESNLSTPDKARDHARAQAGTVVRAMPTIPVSDAKDVPADIDASKLLWDETLAAGDYAARILKRGSRLRLIDLDGDAHVSLLVFNADRPIERLNVADTVKVQWNAYLKQGNLLLSDMGRVLLSITRDDAGHHDTFCGPSTEKSNTRQYGAGENYSKFPNARDRFLLALLKFGLGKKDIPPCINFLKGVRVASDGGLHFNQELNKPGTTIEFRAEMNVLVVLVNAPHILDPREIYTATDLRILAYKGETTRKDDPIRNATPENVRAFENVEDYFT